MKMSDIVLDPIPGNPAEAAGIRAGDRLLAVDGEPVTIAMTVQEVADLIRGEKGTIVVLTVIHINETDTWLILRLSGMIFCCPL
jgi:carboxyl-terminal processing protease